MSQRSVYVHRAELKLRTEDDPRAPGGAVTTALCGHWEHEPPCRWPHNNSEPECAGRTGFRTVFVATREDESEVRQRIESALRSGPWELISTTADQPDEHEAALGERLIRGG